MGFLDSIFGGSTTPNDKQIASAVKALETRHGEPVRRYQAADKLFAWKTPESLSGLLRRYTFNAPADMSDEEEKAYVADLLAKAGRDAVTPIEKYLTNETEVAWPLRILERIVEPDEFRRRVCAVAARLDTHFDRAPERKVDVLHALQPHASDPHVADAAGRFLEDTDDTVRIAATELLAQSAREADREGLLVALLASGDRPRVIDAICATFARHDWGVAPRKADVEKLLPKEYYLTREGVLKRMGKTA